MPRQRCLKKVELGKLDRLLACDACREVVMLKLDDKNRWEKCQGALIQPIPWDEQVGPLTAAIIGRDNMAEEGCSATTVNQVVVSKGGGIKRASGAGRKEEESKGSARRHRLLTSYFAPSDPLRDNRSKRGGSRKRMLILCLIL